MDFREYQLAAEGFALYPRPNGSNHEYATLGLVGEAGEIANKVKKIQRDDLDWYSMRQDIEAELGDVLWYLAALATEFDLNLNRVAEHNIGKLHDRAQRGAIHGSGDDR